MSMSNYTSDYFTIQAILSILEIPIILLSLYFQKFVEKKWCPICLSIIAVILFEVVYALSLGNNFYDLSFFGILVYLFVYIGILTIWFRLKDLFMKLKELKESKVKSNRFSRNYKLFKNVLLTKDKYDLPKNPIILGNFSSNLHIAIITHPYCRHCKAAHEIMEDIYNKHGENLSISILFKIDIENANEDLKLLCRNLVSIHLEKGNKAFNIAMKSWFENKNHKLWLATYGSPTTDVKKIDAILNLHNNWCKDNIITFTPNIFIQGYQFPEMYDRKELIYFINDLVEDSL
jgi:hypothetical protein